VVESHRILIEIYDDIAPSIKTCVIDSVDSNVVISVCCIMTNC